MDSTHTPWSLPIGAQPDSTGTRFRVWAANAQRVAVVLYANGAEQERHALTPEGDGYFSAHVAGVTPGTDYMYSVDGGDPRPDPASRAQPESVHRASRVVDPAAFRWTDGGWRGLPLEELVVYEVHIGTATLEGTFDALIERLDDLRQLGITALEIMPVADFPGDRNWGYDGVNLFAPARAYGGAAGLKRLVDAAHGHGLAVLLDVVYNHFGPDGNYLRQFSTSYFTDRHHTPWGEALNMDGPGSGPVRDYFSANVCYWAHEYHIDGLRLDATHAILDDSPTHILAELATRVHESLPDDRHFLLIAENELNDPVLVRPAQQGGLGLDGVWADDFHHQMRVSLAGDRDGYYIDYEGTAPDIAATLEHGWFYTGQYSKLMEGPRGAPADDVPLPCFVQCIQNHDQVGNRAFGGRLNHEAAPAAYRAASVLLLCSPSTPLLFMGQEWAASSPFLYFTDHNPELGRLVTEGRRSEFAAFASFAGTEIPDPQARETFERSKLRWEERAQSEHQGMLALYQDVLALRARLPALQERARQYMRATALDASTLVLWRTTANTADTLLLLVYLGNEPVTIDLDEHGETIAPTGFRWSLLLDSEAEDYSGSAGSSPFSGGDPATGQLKLTAPRAILLEVAPV